MINTRKLKGRIVAAGYTQSTLAAAVGMSVNSLNAKVNGNAVFNCDEVEAICLALDIIDPVEKCEIFLA